MDTDIILCAECAYGYKDRARFCPSCGTPNPITICSLCGHRYEYRFGFCPVCGTPNPLTITQAKEREESAPQRRAIKPYVVATALLLVLGAGIVYSLSARRSPSATGGKAPGEMPVESAPPKSAPEGMVYVEGGKYTIGRDDGDSYERPAQRGVEVKPFYIDRDEVTCGDYMKFVAATARHVSEGWVRSRCPPGAAQMPVTGVRWKDADDYASWMHKRLPTEVEWEAAARGRDGRLYPWGNDWDTVRANVGKPPSVGRAEPVGSYTAWPSPSGALDMVGNVWEWTSTPIGSYPGGHISEDDLPEAQRLGMKVIRGGCYLSNDTQATVTYRRGWPPLRGGDYNQTGFRCAKDVEQ